MAIPEFILPPQSFCQPLKRLPWRQKREGESSPDTEQNLVIGRLSEDRGYCSRTEGSQLCHHKQLTLTNDYPPRKIPPSGGKGKKTTKGGISTQTGAKSCEEKIAGC